MQLDFDFAKKLVDVDSPADTGAQTTDVDLNRCMADLLEKAVQNEQILKRYQRFELKLLDVINLADLLELLLVTSIEYFQLDAMELWLYDPQRTLEEYIDQPEDYPTLHLVTDLRQLTELYGRQPQVKLKSLINCAKPKIFLRNEQMRSAAMLPLVRHGVLVGSLHMGAKGHQRFAEDKSTDFINHLASVVAVCLENVVNQERLHRLSMYDMLTQVKNRRAFQQSLGEEVSRALRQGDVLSVLFVDLDHFKAINDTHGHQAGDRALKTVAQHIDTMLRKSDHVCRYGGEEFALILPNCSQQRAMEVANRIREQVQALSIENDQAEKFSLTLSIGVTCWQPESSDCEERVAQRLIACADAGVYQAKKLGRNRACYVQFSLAE